MPVNAGLTRKYTSLRHLRLDKTRLLVCRGPTMVGKLGFIPEPEFGLFSVVARLKKVFPKYTQTQIELMIDRLSGRAVIIPLL